MTDQPTENYMDLNTPEQAAEARKLLRWDWSDIALQALTKYQRESLKECTEMGLSALLNDIERELDGMSIDFDSKHRLNIGFESGELKGEASILFASNSSGSPICQIDRTGKISTYTRNSEIYEHPKTYIEFISLNLHYGHLLARLGELHSRLENNALSFTEIRDSFHQFCETVNMPYQDKASDSRNAMWTGEISLLQVQELANGRTSIFFRTGDPDIFDRFTAWHTEHGI